MILIFKSTFGSATQVSPFITMIRKSVYFSVLVAVIFFGAAVALEHVTDLKFLVVVSLTLLNLRLMRAGTIKYCCTVDRR